MNRIILAALVAALAYAAPMRADDKSDKPAEKTADKPKDRAEQLKDLQAEFQKMLPEVIPAFRAAKTDQEREKALDKFEPLRQTGYKLVQQDPKDEVSFNTLMFLLQTSPTPPQKALDLLAEHHVDNPGLGMVSAQLAHATSPEARKFLKTLASKAKDKNVKGGAIYALAQSIHAEAEEPKNQATAATLNKEAESLLESVIKDYADATALKKQAEKSLFEIRNLAIGKTAPEVVSKDLDEKTTKLSDLRGKVVVLDIWATWCGPCRAMIPHEREMVEKLKDKPFAFVSISADEKKETLKDFIETKEKMPWTHWWEGRHDGGILNDWNVQFFPTIYVLDSKGVIRNKNVRGKELEDAVTKLLEEMEKK
jgi:thiol-disulfide isomerase/thioredoxin